MHALKMDCKDEMQDLARGEMIRISDSSIRKFLEYRSTCYYDPDPTDGGDHGIAAVEHR